MHFIVYCKDKPDSLELRMANREAHLNYVRGSDCVRIGGPITGRNDEMAGSVLVLEFDTLDQAQQWSDNDPYAKAGLFQSVEIHPFRWSVGNPDQKG